MPSGVGKRSSGRGHRLVSRRDGDAIGTYAAGCLERLHRAISRLEAAVVAGVAGDAPPALAVEGGGVDTDVRSTGRKVEATHGGGDGVHPHHSIEPTVGLGTVRRIMTPILMMLRRRQPWGNAGTGIASTTEPNLRNSLRGRRLFPPPQSRSPKQPLVWRATRFSMGPL